MLYDKCADIRYKMSQKVRNGGTIGRAKLGYVNVSQPKPGGGEIRTVALDEERAPLIRLAFELYATGDYTLERLADELTSRGLRTRPGKYPAGPISDSKLSLMLSDRYYLGYVALRNHNTGEVEEEFRGRHEPLIDGETFEQVQLIQASRRRAFERQRIYHHYLKGSLWCGVCHDRGIENRMLLQHARGNGGSYDYFYCRGRIDGACTKPYLPAEVVEDVVADHVAGIQLGTEFIARVQSNLVSALADQQSAAKLRRDQLSRELARLDLQEENLLDLAADGSTATVKIRKRLREIELQRQRLSAELEPVEADLTAGVGHLGAALRLLHDIGRLYRAISDLDRRLLNQAIFDKLYVQDEIIAHDMLRSPFDELVTVHRHVTVPQPETRTPSREGRASVPNLAGWSRRPW